MKTQFKYDGNLFQFERNWFTGMFKCIVDDKTFVLDSPLNPLTHLWLTLKRQNTIQVNGKTLTVIHKRPLLLSFAKPHSYEFWVDGKLLHEHEE